MPFLGLWVTGLASGTSETFGAIGIAVGFALPILLGIVLLIPPSSARRAPGCSWGSRSG